MPLDNGKQSSQQYLVGQGRGRNKGNAPKRYMGAAFVLIQWPPVRGTKRTGKISRV